MRYAIALFLLLAACTSQPYVIKERIDQQANTKTETICTHKTYIIPWYIGVAAGFFTVKGKPDCVEQITVLGKQP